MNLKKIIKNPKASIDDLLQGYEEAVSLRHARQKDIEKKYVSIHAAAWVPGLYAYVGMREVINNTEYTTKQKICDCTVILGLEIAKDAVAFGCVYTFYKLTEKFPL